jgi:excisionase family DNA binding protein
MDSLASLAVPRDSALLARVCVWDFHHAGISDALAGNEKGAMRMDYQAEFVRVAVYEHRWLRIEQAAEYVSVTVTAIKAVVRKGVIPHVRFGRRYLIDRRAIDAYLERLQKAQER